jgi:short-subunit dehydrogenase
MEALKMKYALITGGTSGIGFELAKCFAHDNYGIILVSSNQERLSAAKNKLESKYKIPVLIYEQDLSKVGAASELYREIKTSGICVDVLVNNAGYGLVGPTEKIDLQEDENMMMLNVVNLVELCKLFLIDMYNNGNGKILNVASIGAFQPGPYTATYCAGKAFVLSYSRAIRYEAKKKGVQVCALCPGTTHTEFFTREGVKTPRSAMSAEDVAQYAYKRLIANKEISIPGMINKITKIFPVKLKMAHIAKMKN